LRARYKPNRKTKQKRENDRDSEKRAPKEGCRPRNPTFGKQAAVCFNAEFE